MGEIRGRGTSNWFGCAHFGDKNKDIVVFSSSKLLYKVLKLKKIK